MIMHIVGTRPNYVKSAPVIRALDKKGVRQLVVHTSQHYSENMSTDIMDSVGMKNPDIIIPKSDSMGIDKFNHILSSLHEIIGREKPEMVIVYGDVDSTLAAAIATKKNNIRLAHVESGLRSFDDEMPEEINRRLVDEVSDICFITEKSGLENLKGKTNCVKSLVGNTMIDSLVWAQKRGFIDKEYDNEQMKSNSSWDGSKDFAILTFHRPSNVDNEESLKDILEMCKDMDIQTLCPLHPRTEKTMKKFGMFEDFKSINHLHLVEPLTYLDFLRAIKKCSVVVTDSGGIQEETTFLKVPCLTIRENTERPSTIDSGSNMLVKTHEVPGLVKELLESARDYEVPPGWDGNAAERIAEVLL